MDRNVLEELPGAALLTALLAGIAGVAGSYALAGYTEAFIAAPITAWLTERMPAALLRFAIGPVTQFGQLLGIEHLGQQLNLLLAIALATGLFASLVLAALLTGRRLDTRFVQSGLAGGLVWLAATVLTGSPLTALGAGAGSALVVSVGTFTRRIGEPQ
ncbi:sulfite oxidase, partial [Halobacteriales archaeon QS_3_64_16]